MWEPCSTVWSLQNFLCKLCRLLKGDDRLNEDTGEKEELTFRQKVRNADVFSGLFFINSKTRVICPAALMY